MNDPVLIGLRASWQQKHDEAEAIVSNPSATPDQLVKADGLYSERDTLGDQITERKATLDNISALKARSKAGDDWAREPQRSLPHSGAQGSDKSGRGRIETGESEIDRRKMSGGFKSIGHFAWCMVKGGKAGDGEPAAVLAIKDWQDLQR
ncbi:MAG TPA: hypothetical protein VKU80_02135, partial [Planctomycetota bacterium]|nr:hypothetical protein [Planctomycetota bacterium]